jgi:hypothetical protein
MNEIKIFYDHLVFFVAICFILRHFGILCVRLLHFRHFGILYQYKSGSPGLFDIFGHVKTWKPVPSYFWKHGLNVFGGAGQSTNLGNPNIRNTDKSQIFKSMLPVVKMSTRSQPGLQDFSWYNKPKR